jgi:hypothetical protein
MEGFVVDDGIGRDTSLCFFAQSGAQIKLKQAKYASTMWLNVSIPHGMHLTYTFDGQAHVQELGPCDDEQIVFPSNLDIGTITLSFGTNNFTPGQNSYSLVPGYYTLDELTGTDTTLRIPDDVEVIAEQPDAFQKLTSYDRPEHNSPLVESGTWRVTLDKRQRIRVLPLRHIYMALASPLTEAWLADGKFLVPITENERLFRLLLQILNKQFSYAGKVSIYSSSCDLGDAIDRQSLGTNETRCQKLAGITYIRRHVSLL